MRGAARYQGELGIADLTLADQADQTLSAVHQHFATDGPFGPQWSYDTDANGRGSLYHNTNDVPTSVAPLWGLVATDNVRWYNTMRFAWSTHNPGYVPGAFGGLGLATPPECGRLATPRNGPWPALSTTSTGKHR